MSKRRTLSRPLSHDGNTHSRSIILRRWHSTAHTMTRRPACEALVLASSIPVNVIAFESVEHFNHPIASPSVRYAMPSLLQSMRSCRLWGSAHLKVNRKSHLASALCHPHLGVSEPYSESLAPCPWPGIRSVLVRPSQPTQPPSSRDRARSLTKPSPRQDNRLRPPRTVSTMVRSPLRLSVPSSSALCIWVPGVSSASGSLPFASESAQ